MSYIKHSLGRNEELLYRAHFPWFYGFAAWGLILAAALLGAGAYAKGYGGAGALILLGGVALFAAIMIPIWATEVGVTNQRFIDKRGVLWRTTQELQLRAIEEVVLRQSVLGRLFNFGRLELHGTGVDDIRLPLLADPLGLRKALQDATAGAAVAPVGALPGERKSRSAA